MVRFSGNIDNTNKYLIIRAPDITVAILMKEVKFGHDTEVPKFPTISSE